MAQGAHPIYILKHSPSALPQAFNYGKLRGVPHHYAFIKLLLSDKLVFTHPDIEMLIADLQGGQKLAVRDQVIGLFLMLGYFARQGLTLSQMLPLLKGFDRGVNFLKDEYRPFNLVHEFKSIILRTNHDIKNYFSSDLEKYEMFLRDSMRVEELCSLLVSFMEKKTEESLCRLLESMQFVLFSHMSVEPGARSLLRKEIEKATVCKEMGNTFLLAMPGERRLSLALTVSRSDSLMAAVVGCLASEAGMRHVNLDPQAPDLATQLKKILP